MARRLIGLDVGTNAVTLAEVAPGAPPRLDRFGQVALPRDAMRDGEVQDDAAVTEAIARLREEVDLKKASVRVGLASPRLIVRQVEMPVMSRDELASALQFQAADLIPIPLDEAVLDFAILGTAVGEEGEPIMHVLLAAAHKATVMRLVAAVEAAGLPVGAVDLVPLALIRSLARPAYGEDAGAEGIVSFGGGVTAIVVHEGGVPRFVRALGTGGRELTDAICAELELPVETAEALKRQLAVGGDELVVRASQAIERPLGVLLDEVRSSLDYYRNQPGAARMSRVVATGGASQLPGVADRLAALVGVPVELARPRELLAIGDIRFPDEEYPRLDPYLPAAVGLALGGAGVGTVVDLLPREKRGRSGGATGRSSPPLALGIAAGAALLVALAVPTVLKQQDVSSKQEKLSAVEDDTAQIETAIAALHEVEQAQGQLAGTEMQVASLLQTDVSWATMIDDVSQTMPAEVWLSSFQGQVTVPATPTVVAAPTVAPADGAETTTTVAPDPAPIAGPVGGIAGQVSFEGAGRTFPDVANWIKSISTMPSFSNVWVTNATKGTVNNEEVVDFSSTAQLTDAALSDRLQTFLSGSGTEVTP